MVFNFLTWQHVNIGKETPSIHTPLQRLGEIFQLDVFSENIKLLRRCDYASIVTLHEEISEDCNSINLIIVSKTNLAPSVDP